jgi:hypothetical protein
MLINAFKRPVAVFNVKNLNDARSKKYLFDTIARHRLFKGKVSSLPSTLQRVGVVIKRRNFHGVTQCTGYYWVNELNAIYNHKN